MEKDGGNVSEFPDHAQLANLSMIEELYAAYTNDPSSVDPSWRHFFEGIDFGTYLYKRGKEPEADSSNVRIYELFQAYRKYGHLLAKFNPLQAQEESVPQLDLEKLGFFDSEMEKNFPTLGLLKEAQAPLKEIVVALQKIYSASIGFEYMDLANPEIEKWIQGRIEPEFAVEPSIEEKHLLLEYLNKSEVFETFLHTKYVGQTRFSLEGAETMIPLIAEMVDCAGSFGAEEILIGMAHRGRLNVLTNVLNKPLTSILAEFEDDRTLSFYGNDDVRYHMGFSGEFQTRQKKKVIVSMAANPSHLESVDPVVIGQTYAKQLLVKDEKKEKIIPLLIHGDASIAGQGVVYESLQLMNLPSYSVGGTLHLVVNNQIGYTTLPNEGRSTRYCTDIAKTFGCPVFHVNAEDPESCLYAAKLAVEIRSQFHTDVFIDLVCYRKYGHNEGDEPSYTQPLQYEMIRSKKTIRQIYFEKLSSEGKVEQQIAETLEGQFKETMKAALLKVPEQIAGIEEKQGRDLPNLLEPVETKVEEKQLQEVLSVFCKVPDGFSLHPKLQKWLSDRMNSLKGNIDWSTAESLSLGSLLINGTSIRFAGQDSKRGTFSQRHIVWIDSKTAEQYCPFASFKGRCEIVNSPLTEYAGMGFEYGYSWSALDSLTCWEAQYGDFDNGAEIIIDQYIASAEQKWDTKSGLTLLLPHGYEGAGPEHSSGRMERFLQLAANQNMQVVNPSTPAQYFHLLRRQALREVKRPLIVFTPKSLLRSPANVSQIKDLTEGRFIEVLDDPTPPKQAKRLIFCSGKIFYDLTAARQRDDVAIVRVDQLYPLHIDLIKSFIEKYKGAQVMWVQEEPKNMGAWSFIAPHLQNLTSKVHYVGRKENATTATGSNKLHKKEQALLLEQAFGEI